MVLDSRISARSDKGSGMSELTTDLLLALLALVLTSALLTGVLFAIRRYQRSKQPGLPTHNEPSSKLAPRRSHHRRNQSSISISPLPSGSHQQPLYHYDEKQAFTKNRTYSPTPSNLPEIRVTLPEEMDREGKQQAGRVVVVHVGENGVGMGPPTETLPPYQQHASERFQSVDLERIGGLKEKA